MTRLGTSLPGKKVDLAQAFRFLGHAPSYRELGLVVGSLRESGVKDLDYDEDLVDLAEANGSGWHTARDGTRLGMARGSGWHTALDLCSAVVYGVEILYAGPRKARLMKPLEE